MLEESYPSIKYKWCNYINEGMFKNIPFWNGTRPNASSQENNLISLIYKYIFLKEISNKAFLFIKI